MFRIPTDTRIISVNNNKILSLIIVAIQSVVLSPIEANAQVGNSGLLGGSSSGNATSVINNVLQFIIDQMLAVGASLSVVFSLGIIFAIKFGWMSKDKIKDWVWLILAMIALPVLIPLIFQAASGGASLTIGG